MSEAMDNRSFEREILVVASEAYPGAVISQHFELSEQSGFAARVAYLQDHGLLTAKWVPAIDGNPPFPHQFTISARGIDFIRLEIVPWHENGNSEVED